MKIVEITPRPRARLFGTLIDKEAAIRKNGRGTYERVGRKSASAARWRHKMYGGSVQLKRDPSEMVTARIRAAAVSCCALRARRGGRRGAAARIRHGTPDLGAASGETDVPAHDLQRASRLQRQPDPGAR